MRASGWARIAWPVMPIGVGAALLEISVRQGWASSYLVASPTQMLAALAEDAVEFAAAFAETAGAAGLGLTAALGIGTLLAWLVSLSARAELAFRPYAVFFQTVPIVAIAPLLVIWFGFGRPTVVASAAIVALFPVIAAWLAGLHAVSPALADFFRLRGAGPLETLLKLRIPSALPQALTGLRIAAGLSVIGAVVGEFVAGGGLGGIVDAATAQQRVDKVFSAVLLSTLLGFVFVAVVEFARDRIFAKWMRL